MRGSIALMIFCAIGPQAASASSCGELEALMARYDQIRDAALEAPSRSKALCGLWAQQYTIQQQIVSRRAYANKCGHDVSFSMSLYGTVKNLKLSKDNYKSLCTGPGNENLR